MTFVNQAEKEINCKIIYAGPSGSGKTKNLKFIYERTPSDHKGEFMTISSNEDRTGYFDFLPIFLGKIRGFRTRLHIYSVPGDLVLDATRRMLLKGVDGVVFVIDSRRSGLEANISAMRSLEQVLSFHQLDLTRIPLVFQYNKRDFSDAMTIEELNATLNPQGRPFVPSNAKRGDGVLETLKTISRLVLAELTKANDSASGAEQ
jgi:mutual gliding-motility protein MglA